jgi:hypothetical protein
VWWAAAALSVRHVSYSYSCLCPFGGAGDQRWQHLCHHLYLLLLLRLLLRLRLCFLEG